MTSAPVRATIYSSGQAPIFLDTAKIIFAFADGPSIASEVQIARVDYERNAATIVFSESDREAIGVLGPHTAVSTAQLKFIRRAEETAPEISHEMQVTLQSLFPCKPGYGLHSHTEAAITGCLKERCQMLRAEQAIHGHAAYSWRETYSCTDTLNPNGLPSSHFARLAGKARDTALTRLSRLSDGQALSLLEGNRIGDFHGSFPLATIAEVRARRTHLLAAAHMMRRLRERHAKRPFAKYLKHERTAKL